MSFLPTLDHKIQQFITKRDSNLKKSVGCLPHSMRSRGEGGRGHMGVARDFRDHMTGSTVKVEDRKVAHVRYFDTWNSQHEKL